MLFQCAKKIADFLLQTALPDQILWMPAWRRSQLRTLSASDSQKVKATEGMRREIKMRGVDVHSVAATRRLNDPALIVEAKTCSEMKNLSHLSTFAYAVYPITYYPGHC